MFSSIKYSCKVDPFLLELTEHLKHCLIQDTIDFCQCGTQLLAHLFRRKSKAVVITRYFNVLKVSTPNWNSCSSLQDKGHNFESCSFGFKSPF